MNSYEKVNLLIISLIKWINHILIEINQWISPACTKSMAHHIKTSAPMMFVSTPAEWVWTFFATQSKQIRTFSITSEKKTNDRTPSAVPHSNYEPFGYSHSCAKLFRLRQVLLHIVSVSINGTYFQVNNRFRNVTLNLVIFIVQLFFILKLAKL